MPTAIADVSDDERRQVVDWIGERPETVLAVAALRSGAGRLWIEGGPTAPLALLVESALVPGEPQGFGDGEALLRLLEEADRWSCVEVDDVLAGEIEEGFARRWGLAHTVIDVVHEINEPVATYDHPLVRQLTPREALGLPSADADLLPDRQLVAAAAEQGRFFAAVDAGVIVGHGASLASGRVFADVGVHVAGAHRRRGVATACASRACQSLQNDGLIPVWGTSSENTASLAVAQKLGFVEIARLTFLVRGDA
ncbi:MAG: GNAT family N-acetyltransferase [Acidimicrobiales bacterium]